MKDYRGAFTIIELLVVIAIIGLLSTIVTTSVKDSRAKARDSRRMEDLVQIRNAFYLYYEKKEDWMEAGSGCGGGAGGWGWFNYQQSPSFYPKSMSQCLVDEGVISGEIIDPTGGKVNSSPNNDIYAYMKATCSTTIGKKTFLYAKLETKSQSEIATDNTCQNTWDTQYGMNYYIEI